MNILDKLNKSIYELEKLNVRRENLKITTSFILKRVIEEVLFDFGRYTAQSYIKSNTSDKCTIFGVEITFDHFSNEFVIYDRTRACIDNRFKITISENDLLLNNVLQIKK